MKRFFFFTLVFFFVTNLSLAQKLWISSYVELHEENDLESKSLGVLLRGAAVEVLISDKNGLSKVRVDNNMEGFVESFYIQKSLNARDEYTVYKHPIIIDSRHRTPFAYINVASLRGREKPSVNAKVGKVFTMGQNAFFNFYPYDSESWVNVGNYFIQQKYLGKEPVLQELHQQFDNIPKTNLKKRKQIGERMLEFMWISGEDSKLKLSTLDRFLELANQLKDKELIHQTELDIVRVKGMENALTYEEIENLEKSVKIFLLLNGEKILNYELSLDVLIDIKGEPIKTIKEEMDCCYSGNFRYTYDDSEFMVNKKENIAEIVWISLHHQGNAYVVDNYLIDLNTTEEDFVNNFSRMTYYSGLYRDSYSFTFLDYASININFKNGKPYRFEFSIMP